MRKRRRKKKKKKKKKTMTMKEATVSRRGMQRHRRRVHLETLRKASGTRSSSSDWKPPGMQARGAAAVPQAKTRRVAGSRPLQHMEELPRQRNRTPHRQKTFDHAFFFS